MHGERITRLRANVALESSTCIANALFVWHGIQGTLGCRVSFLYGFRYTTHMSGDLNHPVIIYHGDCPDGFGAAWAAWKKLGDAATYIAVQHRTLPPREIEGRDVFTLDYCYPKEIIERELLPKAKSLTVIDHHPSSIEAVATLPGSVLDMNHSGAVLSWNFFHPGVPAPTLLKYVEDTDLWKFALPHSKEISNVLNLKEFGFAEWSRMAEEIEKPERFSTLVEHGALLAEKVQKMVDKMVKTAEEVTFEGYKTLMVNAPFYVSEIGAALVKKLPPIGIIWSRRGGRVVVSLRGDGTVDLNDLAGRYGGGGHHNAAAFSWDEKDFLRFRKP